RGLVPCDLADGARGAEVELAQGRESLRVEERPGVQVADSLLIRVVVGEPGEVAVETAERPIEPALAGLSPGHEAGLARQPKIQWEQGPLRSDEVLLEVVEPGVAVRDQLPAVPDLEGIRRVEVQVAVEEVPGPLEAALERDLVIPEACQPALEVDAHPRNVKAALAERAVVGGEELEVGLVEDVEPEIELIVLGGELEPVGEPCFQGEFPGSAGTAYFAGPPEMGG